MPPLRERREEIPALVEFFLVEVRARRIGARRSGRAPALLRSARRLSVAGQHPRAREHDEALRRAAGRAVHPGRAGPAHAGRAARGGRARRRGTGPGRPPVRTAAPAAPAAASGGHRPNRTSDGPANSDGDPEPASTCRRSSRSASLRVEREAIEQALFAVPLEPAQGRQLPAGQLQDAAEQDEGVRHQRPCGELTGARLPAACVAVVLLE